MKTTLAVLLLMMALLGNVYAADYEYIDPGDYYYINQWGDNNEYVIVVRKMGNKLVKVRNLSTGATQVVNASRLLTKSELDSEELKNAVGGAVLGIGVLLCLANPDECGN